MTFSQPSEERAKDFLDAHVGELVCIDVEHDCLYLGVLHRAGRFFYRVGRWTLAPRNIRAFKSQNNPPRIWVY